jgi:membrane fusion protein (multidrug efflux system)
MKRILLIAIAGLLIISCGSDKKSKLEKLKKQHDEIAEQIKVLEKEIAKDEGKGIEKIADVLVTDIKLTEFNHYLEVQGKIDGDENVAVSPKLVGVVTAVNVTEGQEVSKGQVLATLDDAVYRQSIVTLDSTLIFVTNLYNKQKRLWDQKIGSEVQYLTAKSNKEAVENNIKSLKEQLDMTKIVSPINGTIEEIPIKVGQSVTPGYTTAFRVVNLSKIKVVAEIAEAYAAKLKTGNEVIIKFPDLDKEITSKISFASKYINAINRTFTCEVDLDNTNEAYRANMIAVIKINDYKADSVGHSRQCDPEDRRR